MTAQAQTRSVTRSDTLLRRAMQADAVVTGIVGLAAIVDAGQIAPWLGVPSGALVALGVVLLAWVALLWAMAARPTISRRFAWISVILGALWVVDSAALLVTGWLPLTDQGWWLVAILALLTAAFTEAQYLGLRKA